MQVTRKVINREFPLFLESEQIATLIRVFESELIPGLLQTPDYLFALQAVQLPIPPEVAARIRALRVERQKLMFRRIDNPELEFLIGVGAMHYLMRLPAGVRDGQIARLRELNALANVSIRIVTGLHPAAGNPFNLLTTTSDMPPIAYLGVEGWLQVHRAIGSSVLLRAALRERSGEVGRSRGVSA